jgi:hypothetical protein
VPPTPCSRKQIIRGGHQLLCAVAAPYRMPAAVLADHPKQFSIGGGGAPCGGSNQRRISYGQGAASSADRRAPPIAGARTVEGVLVAARPAASGALTTQVKVRLASLEHGFDRRCSRRSESRRPSLRRFPDPDDDWTTRAGDLEEHPSGDNLCDVRHPLPLHATWSAGKGHWRYCVPRGEPASGHSR